MVSEEWRDIPGHEGWYQVFDLGRVRSLDRLVNAKLGSKRPDKSKVTELDVWAIRFGRDLFPQKKLAEIFGIKQAQVSAIQLGQSWRHSNGG